MGQRHRTYLIFPAFLLCAVLVCGLLYNPVHAQSQPPQSDKLMMDNPEKDMPLEVTAQHVLEWHRNTQQYIAKGDATIKQGRMTISADVITADYRDGETSSIDIYRLTASGNVNVLSDGNRAEGDKLVYDVDKGVAVLTGDDLKLVSPDQIVTANESFEYWALAGRLNAIGNAKVVRTNDTIEAERMSAVFKENKDSGKRELEKMEATGNVKITTEEEVLKGRKASYTSASNIARIIGNVSIARGENILLGEEAEVNLATNISRLFGAPQTSAADSSGTALPDDGSSSSSGRVRGVFYPGGDKAPRITPVTESETDG